MGKSVKSLQGLVSILLVSLSLLSSVVALHKHYIVHLGFSNGGSPLQGDPDEVTRSHHEMISSVSKRIKDDVLDPSTNKIIYSYTRVFNGFAAKLLEEEAAELAKHPNVISIFEDRIVSLQTTHSWDFLGSFQHHNSTSSKSIWKKAKFGEDIIIANFDTGVWPESESFSDEGYDPVPKRFKGKCENEIDPTFKCNRKLIGARFFHKGYAEALKSMTNETFPTNPSLRDREGHGTHTLSIAGGNVVSGGHDLILDILGLQNATLKGGAPRARVAAYKVAWPEISPNLGSGSLMDCMAGMEAAILDGVDIINLSLGLEIPSGKDVQELAAIGGDYYLEESLAVASFHAMAHDIFVVAGAGNNGPIPGALMNFAPWILTVGAGTIDRQFQCYVHLGNHKKFKSARFIDKPLGGNGTLYYPVITGADGRITGVDQNNASYCMSGTLDPKKVEGKIVVCMLEAGIVDMSAKSLEAKMAGAVGVILGNDKRGGDQLLPDGLHSLPTAHVTHKHAQAILSYINSTQTPTALLTHTRTKMGIKPAPIVPQFSSRGPNVITPEILKPDVIAPGVSILSSYTPSPTASMSAKIDTKFIPFSGTSMAAPHVASTAALLKKLHPHWSTSAIKSAIITTASPLSNKKKTILEDDMVHEANPFAFGAGLIQPNLAMDPGLVYDMNLSDYLNFLCAHHFNSTSLKVFTRQHDYECPKSFSLMDFNYPSITVPELSGKVTATRKLKNVGKPGTYKARIKAPHGISISVQPQTLEFSKVDQVLNFKLVFSVEEDENPPTDYVFGSLVWSDGNHTVRSPIAVKGKAP